VDAPCDEACDAREEAGELQVGDEHHHAEQEHERPVVHRLHGGVEREATEGHHEDGTDNGRAGPIEPQARQAAERQHRVGADENQAGDEHRAAAIRSRRRRP
jgi:hypothetical protein